MNYKGIVNYHLEELYDDPKPGQIVAVNRQFWLQKFREETLPYVGDVEKGQDNSIIIIDNEWKTLPAPSNTQITSKSCSDFRHKFRVLW